MSAEINVKELTVNIEKQTVEIPIVGRNAKIIIIENGRAGEIELPEYGEFTFKIHQGRIADIAREARKRGLWTT
ncbi:MULTISPECIES: hypothetical protein [Aneurinibacillus]|uniref:XtrA/YqaO family protein n=1 Tax=Aneurinibacillus thermoaerophilus TaxID=143495 RepID=A0ABX8YBM3_ANETH|nr:MULTISPECIES: hypothetical protein [Aneurinibacillus]AMA74321.1 hypothetical protein ACH33_16895 [Aneurinibacillus sp. XH2]MED0677477.1 hypothetical protein [Aneurinibacillus thermoaerophilus]MED0681337.1 hypothetical protein [Aneurinibacillus thermoaerophilus]MED0737824.1 hypothetical protein [Aneurinibacillus thermoaerophilus]MED0766201.1 hypothetical protein [Aneurinibacillus thermoaerophilus]